MSPQKHTPHYRISFDYDGTLDNDSVQHFARQLVKQGIETWIVSSRMMASSMNPKWNDDLFRTARKVGIPRTRIMLLNMRDKYEFFKHWDGFLWHLDDNWEEARTITEMTGTTGIPYSSSSNWMEQCLKLMDRT